MMRLLAVVHALLASDALQMLKIAAPARGRVRLQGMPGYATWLRTTHPEAFRNAQPGEQFEWVYVDAHDVLHNSVPKHTPWIVSEDANDERAAAG